MEIRRTPEFEATVRLLEEELNATTQWGGRLANSTIRSAVVDVFALFLSSNEFSSIAAMRESFIQLSKRNSSAYAGAIFLGVRLARRNPAITPVEISNLSSEDIFLPAYKQVVIGKSKFFCRESRTLKAKEKTTLDFYEGIVRTKEFNGSDEPFFKIKVGEPDWVIGNEDVRVMTRDNETKALTEWNLKSEGFFDATANDRIFFDTTTSDGDLCITFGDGLFGRRVSSSETVIVNYIITAGLYGNNGAANQTVVFDDPRLTGRTTQAAQGGTGIKSADYYRNYAPIAHRSAGKFSDFGSWKANILLYPGVADVVVRGQRDIAPLDPAWQGVVQVAVLPQVGTWGGQTGANPKSAKWDSFIKWLQSRTNLVVQGFNPVPIYTDVNVRVALKSGYSPEEFKPVYEKAIKRLFLHNDTTLGKRLSRSDIHDAISIDDELNKRMEIDYLEVISPSEDIVPSDVLTYVKLRTLNLIVVKSERKEIL